MKKLTCAKNIFQALPKNIHTDDRLFSSFPNSVDFDYACKQHSLTVQHMPGTFCRFSATTLMPSSASFLLRFCSFYIVIEKKIANERLPIAPKMKMLQLEIEAM